MKVLVVDDSQMTRMVVAKTLRTFAEIEVTEAEDGRKAIEAFAQKEFDLVFSDWNMPNMNGLELLGEIRQRNKTVPVIMITTEGSKDRVQSAIALGVSDYLLKPFTPVALRDKVQKWVAAGTTAP
ncbi:MAG: response regulator [Planctomycetaceae bacterium]|nr:response regulator [Planctomycetaceae bacterium]